MIFAQFWTLDLKGELVHATGDRAILILDGRFADVTHQAWASACCARLGFTAWSLHRGRIGASTQTHPTTKI